MKILAKSRTGFTLLKYLLSDLLVGIILLAGRLTRLSWEGGRVAGRNKLKFFLEIVGTLSGEGIAVAVGGPGGASC